MRSLLLKIRYYSSVLFYRLLKGYFSFMYNNFISHFNKKEWKIFAEKFKMPGALLYVMVNAPRWNTHAIISTVGPLRVDKSITISGLKKVSHETKSWSLVIYNQSNNETVSFISGDTCIDDVSEIQLKKGDYTIGMRLYECKYPLILPVIETNNKADIIHERVLKVEPNLYPISVWKKNSFIYRFLHSYIFILLKGLIKRDNEFITKEFLPVGNPQTDFKYGVILKGKTFFYDFSLIDFNKNLVFYTLYNSSSFPVESGKITSDLFFIERVDYFRAYLIRIVKINHCH